jgi:ATP-dependent protease HslVU (ClpYQ) peptidase subunit
MTAIVGISKNNVIYIGADRGASDGDSIISMSRPKIHINGEWIFGYSGSVGVGQLIEFIKLPTIDKDSDPYEIIRMDIVSKIKELVDDLGVNGEEHYAEFLIGTQGRLFELSTMDWGVLEVEETSIGSGASICLGSLYTSASKTDPAKRIQVAIESAIHYSPTCQHPIDILSL